MIKTLLITGSTAIVVGLSGTLLNLFGGGTLAIEYLGFAVLVVLFVVILIGSSWFVMIKPPENR